jgi:hypothetical protein
VSVATSSTTAGSMMYIMPLVDIQCQPTHSWSCSWQLVYSKWSVAAILCMNLRIPTTVHPPQFTCTCGMNELCKTMGASDGVAACLPPQKCISRAGLGLWAWPDQCMCCGGSPQPHVHSLVHAHSCSGHPGMPVWASQHKGEHGRDRRSSPFWRSPAPSSVASCPDAPRK